MYTDPELFDPQQFCNDLKHSRSELAVFRHALKQGHEVLKERFDTQKNAINYVTQRAWLVDQILQQVWKQCIFPGINYRSEKNEIALIAVGGYGRGELHPRSDVDLLILLKNPMDPDTKDCIEHFVRLLWDIRLEVGHSVRTLAECEQEADADITVVTNLMESRLLVGSDQLFDAMRIAVAPDRVWTHQAFFSAKLEEQNKRETKYDDTANNLEPNIKECPGGLRDIQTIGWVAKRYFGAKTLYDLVQHGFLTEKEYQSLSKGQEFLWEVRCLLHFASNRKEERLLFDHQHTLAKAFGYEDDEFGLAVEKLMKQYYRTVKEIRTLNEMLLQLFEEAILYAQVPATVRPLNKRFQIRNDFIEVTHNKVFINYPFALLEIFLLMSHHPEIKGIRATTIRLMIHYKYLIDETFRRDLRARSLFWEIFRQPEGLTHALRRMNRYGILAAYLPAFGRIVGQMQYDLFHVYTVDQHSLFVVRNLRRLSIPKYSHEFPFCSKLIQEYIPKPELLYLAGLFHDIAKGQGGDHSSLGENEVLEFCHAHGLYDADARLVAWLVGNHLLMSITAQRQDISDPDVIKSFAQLIEDNVRLNYLYLLTVADIRATNSNLWTSWKSTLLTDFYRKTRQFLLHNQEQVLDKQRHIQEIQKNTQRLLNQQSYERVTTLWKELGDEYFLYSSAQDVARETQIILNHNGQSEQPVVLERQTTRGGTGIIVIDTKGCDYLFADTTYFFEQHNLTVVDAYIIPSDSKYTISGYTVVEDDGTEITPKERVEEVLQSLTKALSRNDTNAPFYPINRRIPGHLKHFPELTRVNFTQDHINNHTTVQVITTDRPGVLSRIAQAFLACQIRVKKAKIATFGTRVEDVFFVTDYDNHALYSTKQLDCLRDKLSELLDEDMPKLN
jgi:[protein-PII] uridylyltransferase